MAEMKGNMIVADAAEIQKIFDNAKSRMEAAKKNPALAHYSNRFGNHLCGSLGEFACDEFAQKHDLAVVPDYSQSIFGRIDMKFGRDGIEREISVKTTSRMSRRNLYPKRQVKYLGDTTIVIWCYSHHALDVFNDEEPPKDLPRNCAVELQGWSYGSEVRDGTKVTEIYDAAQVSFREPKTVHQVDDLLGLFRK